MPEDFRFAAKKAFLTYPQAHSIPSKEALLQHLLSLGTGIRCIVAAENHQDGGIHYHAVVEYRVRIDTTNEHFLIS